MHVIIVPHKPRLHVSCNLGMRQEPGSASLPCTQLLFAAEPGRRLYALLCHTTVDNHWQFYFTPCFRHPLKQICRGAQPPASSVQGGCSSPRSPASYASVTGYSMQVMSINLWLRKCSGQSRYGCYGFYATPGVMGLARQNICK